MEDKKPYKSVLTVALIAIVILLILLGGMQYSLKHGLPIAARLGAWLARGSADAAITPAPDTAATPAPEVDLYQNAASIASYEAYLKDTLFPAYGQASQAAVAAARNGGYAFAADADTTGATGLLSAEVIDLDNDGTSELVVLGIAESNGGYPLELRIFGMSNGAIRELAASATVVTDMAQPSAALTETVEIVSQNTRYYLLYHQYVESDAAFYDRYVAFDITAGEVQQALDGVYAYYNGAVLVANIVPPWLAADTLSGAPTLTDAMSGLSGTALYADEITDAPYGGGTASYTAYTALYDSAVSALDVMLGPLGSASRMTLLDPLSRDWTGLAALLSETEAEPTEADAEYADEPMPEFDEEMDGYVPPDDYVELEPPE